MDIEVFSAAALATIHVKKWPIQPVRRILLRRLNQIRLDSIPDWLALISRTWQLCPTSGQPTLTVRRQNVLTIFHNIRTDPTDQYGTLSNYIHRRHLPPS